MKVGGLVEGVFKLWISVPATERISNGVLVAREIKSADLKIKEESIKPKFA